MKRAVCLILVIVSLFLLSSCSQPLGEATTYSGSDSVVGAVAPGTGTIPTTTSCGDGTCSASETFLNCPYDCGNAGPDAPTLKKEQVYTVKFDETTDKGTVQAKSLIDEPNTPWAPAGSVLAADGKGSVYIASRWGAENIYILLTKINSELALQGYSFLPEADSAYMIKTGSNPRHIARDAPSSITVADTGEIRIGGSVYYERNLNDIWVGAWDTSLFYKGSFEKSGTSQGVKYADDMIYSVASGNGKAYAVGCINKAGLAIYDTGARYGGGPRIDSWIGMISNPLTGKIVPEKELVTNPMDVSIITTTKPSKLYLTESVAQQVVVAPSGVYVAGRYQKIPSNPAGMNNHNWYVQKYTPDLQLQKEFSQQYPGTPSFIQIRGTCSGFSYFTARDISGLAVDKEGTVFVALAILNKIVKLSSDFTVQKEWIGKCGNSLGDIGKTTVKRMVSDNKGHIYALTVSTSDSSTTSTQSCLVTLDNELNVKNSFVFPERDVPAEVIQRAPSGTQAATRKQIYSIVASDLIVDQEGNLFVVGNIQGNKGYSYGNTFLSKFLWAGKYG